MDISLFEYERKDDFSIKSIKKTKKYEVFLVKFSSPFPTEVKEGHYAWGLYYRAANSKNAVIVLHGLSMVFTTRYFCWKLARKEISSFMLIMPYAPARIPKRKPFSKLPENINFVEAFKKGLIQSVVDVRKTIDFLKKENKSIGILGISLGANISALVHCIDDRITSGILIVGGGDLANMLWESRDFIARFYKRILSKYITKQELIERWKDIDPLSYAKKGLRVIMINAKFDTSVKPVYSKKLWEALGKPEIHWINCAHFFITHIFFIKNLILSYFRRTL